MVRKMRLRTTRNLIVQIRMPYQISAKSELIVKHILDPMYDLNRVQSQLKGDCKHIQLHQQMMEL